MSLMIWYHANMTMTPFRDTAKKIYVELDRDYIAMQVGSNRARSHGWWRNLVEWGAWEGPGGTRVGPPTPESFEGIAKLFKTTVDEVRRMIAADWYGIRPEEQAEVSVRSRLLVPILEKLEAEDADLVEQIARRLGER
jgi:hypothetical protein